MYHVQCTLFIKMVYGTLYMYNLCDIDMLHMYHSQGTLYIIHEASMTDGATDRQVGNLVS